MGKIGSMLKSLKTKLIIWFLVLALIPLILTTVISYRIASSNIEKQIFNELEAINTLKGRDIISFINERKSDLTVLSESEDVRSAFELLKAYHDGSGVEEDGSVNINTPEYKEIYKKIDAFFMHYIKAYKYNDLFLLCAKHGHVLYSSKKEKDLGTNLGNGGYSDSGLAHLWRDVASEEKFVMVDYSLYAPLGEPAAFVGMPLNNSDGKIEAVIALQISAANIDHIMQERTGMGETGESYIVGGDYLMKSNSRFEKDTIMKREVRTKAVERVLNQKKGVDIIEDYRGVDVLSAYQHLGLDEEFGVDFEWSVISEIDLEEGLKPMSKLMMITLVTIGITILVIIAAAIFIARQITKPVEELVSISTRIAGGDLTGTIDKKSDDEIGILSVSFNDMSSSLREVLQKIHKAVNQITSASGEILSATQEQAAGTREQSSAVAETTTAAKELLTSSEQVGDSIKQVSDAAAHALMGMAGIKEAISKTGDMITLLGEKSQEIGKITGLIDDVADQTNLLAVNASIEAARAGEQGRGFTVVADEIRKLSDSTAKSTKDITSLIEVIQHEMSNVVISMEKSVNNVDDEVSLAQKTAEKAKEISMSAHQQISGSKQIAEAMGNIDEVMKQIATGTQQTEASIKQLMDLGTELENIIDGFKTS